VDVQSSAWYRTALECLVGVPATDGNRVDVLRNGEEAFPAMLDAIRSAETTVDMQTFGHWNGSVGAEFTDALADRAKAGVRVRLLLDALGSRKMEHHFLQRISEAGADVQWFRPLTNWRFTQSTHRGHRKLLICDAQVAFNGGIGIDDCWIGGGWRDTNVRVRGPAVSGLRGAFTNNWAETRRPIWDLDVDPFPDQPEDGTCAVQVVRGDAETGWGDISTLIRAFLGLARDRIRICASYFVPDAATLALLRAAAERGVAVELLRPRSYVSSRVSHLASDAQSQSLLDAGVRIWAYRPSGFQVKVMIVDGVMASIGAANFNSRSLTLDDEVNVVLFDSEVVRLLDDHFDDDLTRSQEITSDTWRQRPLRRKAAELVPGFLARHL
jgi:cardiolipin synthase